MRKDHFTDEALAAAKALARLDYAEEASAEALDFARCQRPDGSFYGTSGQCRTGTPAGAKQGEKSKVIQAPGADPAVMRRKELEEEKRTARMRATNERADAREKSRKEAKRRPEEDVRRPGGKLIGTSPRNMSIDGLKELKKEAADFRKKFGSRANEEKIAKVFKVYEDRIAAQEKFIKDKYGDE
jgi:hypothetical protein